MNDQIPANEGHLWSAIFALPLVKVCLRKRSYDIIKAMISLRLLKPWGCLHGPNSPRNSIAFMMSQVLFLRYTFAKANISA